jgi:predicted transcriptional regulator of viral defense system
MTLIVTFSEEKTINMETKAPCVTKNATLDKMGTKRVLPRDLADHFLASGRYAFTVEEAAAELGITKPHARQVLARLRQRHEVFSPVRGLYIAIPPDFRSWGVVPGAWFIDSMMRHLDRPYYIALLAAAQLHGASHQAPQALHVVTDGTPLRDRDLERVHLRFLKSRHVAEDATERITVPTGYAIVSAKETTIVDLITHARVSGGYGNVATIIKELGRVSGSELARIASRRGRATVRRVGWFTEQFGDVDDLEALRQASRPDVGDPSLVDPAGPKRGKTDPAWRLRLNATVEADF